MMPTVKCPQCGRQIEMKIDDYVGTDGTVSVYCEDCDVNVKSNEDGTWVDKGFV